jgi:biopolymer transport protein ExbD
MSLRITCDNCGTSFRLPERLEGQIPACPHCGVRVPPQELPAPLNEPQTSDPVQTGDDQEPLIKPTKKIDFEDLIDMTAMVDIVFFLLIFFLVTSLQTVDSAIEMPLPDVKSGAGKEQAAASDPVTQRDEVVVRIDRADRISVDGTEVRGPDELYLHLRKLRTNAGVPSVLRVVGSGGATHGTLVTVLDSGHELGFERIQLSVVEDEDDSR